MKTIISTTTKIKNILVLFNYDLENSKLFPEIKEWLKNAQPYKKNIVFNIFGASNSIPNFFDKSIDLVVLDKGVPLPDWLGDIPSIQLGYPSRCSTRIENKPIYADFVTMAYTKDVFAYVKVNPYFYESAEYHPVAFQITCKKENYTGLRREIGIPLIYKKKVKDSNELSNNFILSYDVLGSKIQPNSSYAVISEEEDGVLPLIGDPISREIIKRLICLE